MSRIKHGESVRGKVSRLYRIWENMMDRTSNPKNSSYKNYGGRGITVCSEWKNANAFILWAKSNGYRDDLLLDRSDNDEGYSPQNCRFVSLSVSQKNKRQRSDYGIRRHSKNSYQVQITRDKKVYYGGSTRDISKAIQMRDELLYKLDYDR